VAIEGMVSSDPEVSDKTSHLYLSARKIKLDGRWQEVSGTALLIVPRYPAYNYGDALLVTGELDDYDDESYQPYSIMFYPEIEILGRGKGFKPLELVYSLRNHLSQTLAQILPEPQASLAQGIVLGLRGGVPALVKEAFAHSGIAHLLAISGLHLSIVAGILLSIGLWLFGRRHYIYIWLALGAIWLYALLTGMCPPVVRGAIMASLFLTAELLGRQRSAFTALAFAAAIMVGINPRILWYASFQLSFLAMCGLILIFPYLRRIGRKVVSTTLGEEGTAVSVANTTVDGLSVTLGAIIAVWPVIAYHFGIVSLVAPIATVLALPVLPGIIITGALAGGLGLIILPVAKVVGWLTWLFLSYLLLVANALAAPSIAFLRVDAISNNPTLILAYYLVLGVVTWLTRYPQQGRNLTTKALTSAKAGIGGATNFVSRLPKKWVIPPLLVLAILTSVAAATMPDDNLRVSFLDIGQGDAILIQTPAHQDILVDGGPSPQVINLELSQKMPFWDRTIDLVILTHPSADHVTGLVAVLERYKVKQVLYPDLAFESDVYQEWLNLIEEKGIERILAQTGQQIGLGRGVVIEVLNPQDPLLTDTESDIDNNGVVLHLSIGEVSFLFTADIMQSAEFELISQRANLRSTVLKVAHHGSNTSTTSEFLSMVNPRLAVISVGEDNPFGHPTDAVMERLEEKIGLENIYCTDEQGTIEFITNGERLWVKVEK